MISHIKLVQETLTFGDIEIEKNKFYRNKTPIDKDIEKIVVYNNIFWGEKKTVNTLLVTYIMMIS